MTLNLIYSIWIGRKQQISELNLQLKSQKIDI
jgi:hypothetical protein